MRLSGLRMDQFEMLIGEIFRRQEYTVEMSAAMSAEDFDGLATALDKAATFAPAGYTNWASIAKDGAGAAHAQSLDGVKASCRGCHNQYKDKYKKEMRDRPI